MTADYTNQIAAGLLMFSLVSVLAVGILAGFVALIHTRRRRALDPGPRLARTAGDSLPRPRYQPSIFEHSCRWLAIKSPPT